MSGSNHERNNRPFVQLRLHHKGEHKKILTFIDCMSKRHNRLVLSHALTQVFTDFLVKDTKAAILELVKVNEELRLTWGKILELSNSKVDLENTCARLYTSRTGGDILDTLSKYTTESKNIYGMKINDYILNNPFDKECDDIMEAVLERYLNKICVNIYRGYKDYNPDCSILDATTEDWFLLHDEDDDYLTNPHVNEFVKFSVRCDLNIECEKGYEFSIIERMIDDLWEF